jgi:glycosyltransferase involved in cell wall biosynthesis
MRVLYANHTGRVSGGERSLLDLLGGVPANLVPIVACPRGALAAHVRARGLVHLNLPEIEASFRLHPVHTPAALGRLLQGAIRLRLFARRSGAELIHANSARAGLIAAVAHLLGGPPVVVSVRDCLPDSPLGNQVRSVIRKHSAVVIANSRYTAKRFQGNRDRGRVIAIHNPVDLDRFDPRRCSRKSARDRLGLDSTTPVLGIVGQLAPWKGQDDALRIVALLRAAWPRLRLLVVGTAVFSSRSTRFDNQAYAAFLHHLGNELGLDGSVQFLGEREDVPELLRAFDVLLVPSWEEPFGRSVVEAMAMETPVVATANGGPSEIIRDGIDGVLLPPRQPQRWATTITDLLRDQAYGRRIGIEARRRVLRCFRLDQHVGRVLDVYERVLSNSLN